MAVERVFDRLADSGDPANSEVEGKSFNLDILFSSEKDQLQAIRAGRYILLGVQTQNFKAEKWQSFLDSAAGQFLSCPSDKLEGATPLSIVQKEVAEQIKAAEEKKKSIPHKARKSKPKTGGDVDWINRGNW
jgi:hypothetical protein